MINALVQIRTIAELPDGKDKTDIQQRLAAIEQALR